MSNFKVETLMGTSKTIVFQKRAGGWCEPVENAFESTPELHGDISHCRFKCRYVMKRIGFGRSIRVATRVALVPLTKGWGLFLLSFFIDVNLEEEYDVRH
ncbi:hypothetical protein B0H99_12513 [Planomicrobium soli]|uniref:Uncharacterized protein n=1 Tax=Planomicrobium soli TaxID=1176648 RepID=A0A2P8FRQ5_9BACL|nr:hypothetical protein B0H99_12513 [Planomicrobium soli]